jgi:hypothetical protein
MSENQACIDPFETLELDDIEITIVKSDKSALSKKIKLEDGEIRSDGSQCRMAKGSARRATIGQDLRLLREIISGLQKNEALVLGRLNSDLDDKVPLATKRAITSGRASTGAVARTRENIDYRNGKPGLMLFDFDIKGMPAATKEKVAEAGGLFEAMMIAVPSFVEIGRLSRASTSAGLSSRETGKSFAGSGGEHHYVIIDDAGQIERCLINIHDRLWLAGLGWYTVGRAGQLLERSLIDKSVWAPERLVFEAAPDLAPPLVQDADAREPKVHEGDIFQCSSLQDFDHSARSNLEHLKSEARAGMQERARKVRERYQHGQAQYLSALGDHPIEFYRRMTMLQCSGILTSEINLDFDDPELGICTVSKVLADPNNFFGETLADPLEGPNYGRCKAMVLRGKDGWPFIHSFAHGKTLYDLRHDKGSLTDIIAASPVDRLIERYATAHIFAEITPDEEDGLVRLVKEKTGIAIPAIKKRLKADRETLRQDRSDGEATNRLDGRIPLKAPNPDGELTPILKKIDEILVQNGSAAPPMRDSRGLLVELARSSIFEILPFGDGDNHESDILPTARPSSIAALDVGQVIILVEKYIRFYRKGDTGERNVRLPSNFAEAYRNWSDSELPIIRSIITAPVIQLNGSPLSGEGLDQHSGQFFDIDPALQKCVREGPIKVEDAQTAWNFLVDDWLVDVSANLEGKAIAIAFAMTVIERTLLPERPAFLFVASQRGSGKTTLVNMITCAVLGRPAPASPWAKNEDERRKALMSFFQSGVPTIIWDNIERGTQIQCAQIEAALTSATHSDRILGATRHEEVPSQTVIAFTGNNILPKGDLASRSLLCRLNVSRPDPENRKFYHADPLAWTVGNRKKILSALYTLLQWRPDSDENEQPKTRFKTWWRLVGKPIESITKGSEQPVCFARLFRALESDDEEGAGINILYKYLFEMFQTEKFCAADFHSRLEPSFADLDSEGGQTRKGPSGDELKAALEDATGRSFPARFTVSSHAIGKRLQMIVGRPAEVEGRLLILMKQTDRQAGNRYYLDAM